MAEVSPKRVYDACRYPDFNMQALLGRNIAMRLLPARARSWRSTVLTQQRPPAPHRFFSDDVMARAALEAAAGVFCVSTNLGQKLNACWDLDQSTKHYADTLPLMDWLAVQSMLPMYCIARCASIVRSGISSA